MKRRRRFVSTTREKRRRSRLSTIAFLAIMLFALLAAGYIAFRNYHFAPNTIIEETDCSWMTVEEAKNKIEEKISEDTIMLVFPEGKSRVILAKIVGIHLKDTEELNSIFEEQMLKFGFRKQKYNLKNSVLPDEQKINQYLSTLPEFQKQNAKKAQNAYIEWSDEQKKMIIVPEVYGFNVSVEQAAKFAYETIEGNSWIVDFTKIVESPEVKSDDLQDEVNELNDTLFGGSIYKTNGSHGCVNMPLKAAKTLYENIDSSIPIIVYKS